MKLTHWEGENDIKEHILRLYFLFEKSTSMTEASKIDDKIIAITHFIGSKTVNRWFGFR